MCVSQVLALYINSTERTQKAILKDTKRDSQTYAATPRFQSICLYTRRYGTLSSRKEGTYGSTRNTQNRPWDRAGPGY
jgi:hypothetical protein